MIELVAFLGNCGHEYAATRHNVAWLFADSLAVASSLSWQKKFHGEFATVDRAQCARGTEKHALPDGADYSGVLSAKLYFLKPHTYMNASGESIGEAAQFFKIAPAHILVVHDELELP
ncbi:MAG: peptidyl-tRNA hydrolase, partial [Treponema sp.]|nr:peptidyl-tRNA hydrolase [Treponema sp.]